MASSFYLVAKAIFPHHRPFNNHRTIDDYFVHLCRFPQCWNLHCTESSSLKLHRFQTPKSNKYSSGLDEDMLPVWRQIGDIIDSHISWLWKHFFASKIVLRVIWLFSIIFVASFHVFKSSCPSFVSSHCLPLGTAGLSSCRQSLSMVVTSLGRFQCAFVSSVFPFVDVDTYLV